MNCTKYERWISDSLDGELSEKARRELERHLTGCPSCRAYRELLERIQGGASAPCAPSVPDGYWGAFSARVRARLESGAPVPRRTPVQSRVWRWAWLAAPAAAGVMIFLLVFRPGVLPVSDVLTYEGRLDAVSQSASEDAELAGRLDAVILSSIQEETGVLSAEELPALADDPAFWDSLTEEEASLLDLEIAKELKS